MTAGRQPRFLVTTVAAVSLLAASCSSGSGSGADRPLTTARHGSSTTSTAAGTARATPTTAAPASTAAPPASPPGYGSAREAAAHLLETWRAGDRAGASAAADPAAVDALFAVPVGAVTERGCDTGEFDTSSCQYRAAGGGLQLDMERHPPGWVVSGARFSPT